MGSLVGASGARVCGLSVSLRDALSVSLPKLRGSILLGRDKLLVSQDSTTIAGYLWAGVVVESNIAQLSNSTAGVCSFKLNNECEQE